MKSGFTPFAIIILQRVVEDSHLLGYAAFMSRLLILILSCLPLLAFAGNFYKWVDNKGVVHYTDKPVAEAEVLTLPDSPPAPPEEPYSSQSSDTENGSDDDTGAGYTQFAIGTPENDSTIRSNEGLVNVSFFIAPPLRPGHKIDVTLDGQKLKGQLSSTQFSLKDIPRGTHTLKANIVDEKGQTVASANAVSFHLRQKSILHPSPKH